MRIRGTVAARRHEIAPVAPMPTDPTQCRWCGGRLKALVEGQPATYCQAGCARNDLPAFFGQCDECGRDFHTGERHARLCHGCKAAVLAEITETSRVAHATRDGDRIGKNDYSDWARRR